VDADAVELRVLGCLLEKQRTTPDAYPLSLNALRLACNQSTNRDPVVDYDEVTVRDGARRLAAREWARLASGPGSRAVKYRHLLDRALGLAAPELALLAVLMLRGPQTPGELKQRCERLHAFASLAEIEETLGGLAGRGLVERQERRPGQKEERWTQLLGETAPGGPHPAARDAAPAEQRITPYLLYEDADAAVEWLVRAFGFRVVERTIGGAGGTHVELGTDPHGTRVYLGQPPGDFAGPGTVGRTSLVFALVDDVDGHHARALAAGAEIVEEPNDAPTGHRRYGCRDPQGHEWFFARPLPA
jgi:uncharacterized protein YceH (UPF0502 family)